MSDVDYQVVSDGAVRQLRRRADVDGGCGRRRPASADDVERFQTRLQRRIGGEDAALRRRVGAGGGRCLGTLGTVDGLVMVVTVTFVVMVMVAVVGGCGGRRRRRRECPVTVADLTVTHLSAANGGATGAGVRSEDDQSTPRRKLELLRVAEPVL